MGGGKGQKFSDKNWDREQQQKPTEANDVKSPQKAFTEGLIRKKPSTPTKTYFSGMRFKTDRRKID